MAKYFASHGWENINIAFPVNIRGVEELNELSKKVNFSFHIVNVESAKYLCESLKHTCQFFIEIDAGYHRTGVSNKDLEKIDQILHKTQGSILHFKGFYIHAGHTYHADAKGLSTIHQTSLNALRQLKAHYINDYPKLICRYGDTPSASIMDDFIGVDELGPGNFIFYDLTQAQIGSCSKGDIAVALACPVVDKNKERREIVIHGGGVHLAKDKIEDKLGAIYGQMVWLSEDRWSAPVEGAYVRSISQEHGILRVSDAIYNQMQIGDVVGILPVHSCMTADAMKAYWTLSGDKIEHLEGLSL